MTFKKESHIMKCGHECGVHYLLCTPLATRYTYTDGKIMQDCHSLRVILGCIPYTWKLLLMKGPISQEINFADKLEAEQVQTFHHGLAFPSAAGPVEWWNHPLQT